MIKVQLEAAYNTDTGTFTAFATVVYQIMISNMYAGSNSLGNMLSARIVVNSVTNVETATSLTPIVGTTIYGTIFTNTIASMTSGQTASITIGNLCNVMTPSVGTGQQVLKIIRLN